MTVIFSILHFIYGSSILLIQYNSYFNPNQCMESTMRLYGVYLCLMSGHGDE